MHDYFTKRYNEMFINLFILIKSSIFVSLYLDFKIIFIIIILFWFTSNIP